MKQPLYCYIFFDGICVLCNNLVDFLIKHDKHDRLRFASLQGETAKEKLPSSLRENLDTIVVQKEAQNYYKSSAVLQIIKTLGFPWNLLLIGYIFPKKIRDMIYNFIAQRRFKWFGKRETCRIPYKEEKYKILP